jgi:hypothetical protein
MIIKDRTQTIGKTARVAGILYLLVAVFGAFGIIYVPSSLIVLGDMSATARNIVASESLFRLGIVSALVTQVIQIALVLVLYQLLKPVNRNYALLMVVLILVAVPIAMLGELNHVAALILLTSVDSLTGFTPPQIHDLASLLLDLREHAINIAQIFWGLWLFPMGYLIFKSGYIPRILGILLMIGCAGYLIDWVLFFLFPDVTMTVSQFTFIGELLFPIWLVVKGVDVAGWQQRALQPA